MLWKIILSALLLIFSFPNFNLSFLAFIGFIPLFYAVENKSPQKAFLISFICGFIFYLGTLYWLYHVTVIGLIILCLYLALSFGIFGMVINRFSVLAAPMAWVLLEYLQAHLFTGFGWALLGYSQYRNTALIQIADFSGVYGVSFVVMAVNAGIYMSLRTKRNNLCLITMTILILAANYAYGFFKLNEKHNANSIKVSVVQGNIPQELKWDPEARGMIIEKYSALTKMAALDGADLVVWPETSFPGFFETDKEMTAGVLDLAEEINTPVLIGTNTEKDYQYFNSAVLVSGQGGIVDKYDKMHLVPFGEYVPFSDKFPALHDLILGEVGEFTPGEEFKIFVGGGRDRPLEAKFGVLICFEDIFPEIAKKFVKNGAKFLIVITNDAWYGKSGAAYQHAACSVFRAIENRVPVVRCANTGYSCFIDSKGRIYDSVEEKGDNLFITGYKTSEIIIK
ncbi:MAG: apolipoprotein N-acyltransferase [Candidatus Omnitrophota bacterium]|jgi:apolipoprotein N-acyltransferase